MKFPKVPFSAKREKFGDVKDLQALEGRSRAAILVTVFVIHETKEGNDSTKILAFSSEFVVTEPCVSAR